MVKKYTKKARTPKRTFKRTSRKSNKSLVSLIKRVALKSNETKFGSYNAENQQLYHNGGTAATYNWINNLLGTAQGNNQQSRVGDRVIAKGLSVHLWISNKLDRPNVMYRIIIYTNPPDQYNVASPSNFFQGLHANKMIDYVNTDKYKIVYHKIIKPFAGDFSLEASATNKEHSTFVKIYIPLKNRSITYLSDAGAVPNNQSNTYSLCLLAYDAYGSLTTDNIASFSYCTKFYFKDP